MNVHYLPDRQHEIEKVQKEILQQHKYLESQLNSLRDAISSVCSSNGLNCNSLYTRHVDVHNNGSNDFVRNPHVRDHAVHYNNLGVRRF
ncbi:ORF86 [Plodia interpunctella granulovirus]|uniref:ORF86 n=1 Tax=Plodia interpunctella granulovirus TaxID=262175 RepID=A0A1L5JHG9_9BBAC|nr:ORF86 [Plodia interpunctella granulovirus]APO13970.1 ORF86 [Plodia interpunctella granulovirus]